ncbi:MAG: DUF362 domain-containing protein [Desulfuromonadaceae bacterium]|nr:DUF362 domain-containing protein [Desulfuromonadaceae bacterium]
MSGKVYFADTRTSSEENLHDKVLRLMEAAGIENVIHSGDLTAVKTHFGEKGGHAYVRPTFLRRVIDRLRRGGALPFITDSCTLYPGERKEAVSALRCGIENGLAFAVVGAPLILCDGLRGHSARRVPIDGGILASVDIGEVILEADSMVVVSHFKGHELTGFGGAIKNLGMGCSSRQGKMEQHSSIAPRVSEEACTACRVCLKACAHDAIVMKGKAFIVPGKCVGCARCIGVCPERAIRIQWNESADMAMKKMAEYALGALHGKKGKALFINFIVQVSPDCDCYPHSDAPIVPDIGILAGTDPVALDQASADLVNQSAGLPNTALKSGHEPGGDKFRGVHPAIDWETTLEHGEKIGLGGRKYELVRF